MSRLRRAPARLFDRLRPLWQVEKSGGLAVIALRARLALPVWLLALVWYIARPSAVAVVALVTLSGLLAAGYGWARQMALGLSAQRRLQYAAVQVGDEIEEIVTLRNDSFLPVLWAEFADQSNIPGYSLSSVRAVDEKSSLQWRVHSVCRLRGNYRFGPWHLLTGDPFGLFQVTLTYPQQEEILVYPPLAALPETILPRGRARGEERPLRQPLAAESLSALAARPYLPGDALRRIHWPTSARRAAPFVKTFDPEAASSLWIIPDLDSAVQRGSGPQSTLETIILLAASLAARLLNERLAVGIIAHDRVPQVVRPARGQAQLWPILRLLAGLQAEARPLDETLRRARRLIPARDRVLVLTPSLQPDWAAALQRVTAGGSRSNAEVIVLDAAGFDPTARAPAGSADAFAALLAGWGIAARVLRQGDVQPLTSPYGEPSRWEFKTLGTGRAFARRAPRRRAAAP